jgi:hypothetical protein
MKHATILTEAGHKYQAAYSAHYTDRDLPLALTRYQNLMKTHPDTQEAKYSRTQIQNILNAVVPKQDLLNAQMELANAQFKQKEPQGIPVSPPPMEAVGSSGSC